MANEDHLATLLLGVEFWNDWRRHKVELQPDLSGVALPEADLALADLGGANLRRADLHGADLGGANLVGADLGGVNLRGASLRGADLSWAYLSEADLRGADLAEANFGEANLTEANLAKADLSSADLHGANLRGANLFEAALIGSNFYEATVAGTKFGDVNLNAVKGLASVKHTAPSTIGIDTLYRSRGEIPEVFLRGAGVPENFIRFVNTWPRKHEPTYSCFICHSYKDRRFCDRLYADLQANGVRTWYVPEDAPRGRRFFAESAVRVRMFDKVIAVCSKHSLQSKAVVQEIEYSLKREREELHTILFPVRLDNYLLKDWPHSQRALVAEKVVADFRGWTRSAAKYEDAFRYLLQALKAT